MIKAAVIGANGFLGRQISATLEHLGYDVTGVYNRRQEAIISSKKLSYAAFIGEQHTFDYIIHAAGNFSLPHKDLIDINCRQLIEIAERYPDAHMQYISSVNVYGVHTEAVNECSSYNSPGLYAQAKLCGEFIASSCKRYSIIRMTYIYGPGLDNGSFIPILMNKARSEGRITLFGAGARAQDYIYVEDAATFCAKVFELDINGIFLGATGTAVSNLEVAEAIAANVQGCTITFAGEDKGISFIIDPSETFRRLNWRPQVQINDGIKKMLQ